MQAIVTKFISPTDHRPSRIKATCQARSITLSWDHAKNPSGNHEMAARALAERLGWAGDWIAGDLPDGSTAWTCNYRHHADYFTVTERETLPAPPAAVYVAGQWISSTD